MEVNNCTKAGQLHESLSGQNRGSPSNSAKLSTEFVKASQLLGERSSTSASISERKSSLPSFAPASKYFPAVAASTSNNSAAARDDVISFQAASVNFPDSNVGFCPASKLLSNHVSDMAATCNEAGPMKKKRDSTLVSVSREPERTSRSSSPGGALPDSTSEQNVVVIDLTDMTSEGESKIDPGVGGSGGGGGGKKEPPMTTKPTSRKRKIDQAVANTKKITYFFEK
jgi:hypothetical protein